MTIPSGVVRYNRTTAGSEALYICDDGFHQNSAATRVCQSDGVWNGGIPQCLPEQDGTYVSIHYYAAVHEKAEEWLCVEQSRELFSEIMQP